MVIILVPAVWIGLALLTGLLFASHAFGRLLSFEQGLNALLTLFLIFVLLPVSHHAVHRWYWHLAHRKAGNSHKGPPLLSEKTLPPPPLMASTGEKLAYAGLYAAAMALLVFIYLPLGHHETIHRFISSHSSGTATARWLTSALIIWLPQILGIGTLVFYINHDQKKPAATEAERQQAALKYNWLLAFVASVCGVSLLCFMQGIMILLTLA